MSEDVKHSREMGADAHHDVLWLKEPTHDIQDAGLSDHLQPIRLLAVNGKRRVARHEEVAPRGWHQARNQPHQVIVHVACKARRVAELNTRAEAPAFRSIMLVGCIDGGEQPLLCVEMRTRQG